jgi:hypothetical protein
MLVLKHLYKVKKMLYNVPRVLSIDIERQTNADL